MSVSGRLQVVIDCNGFPLNIKYDDFVWLHLCVSILYDLTTLPLSSMGLFSVSQHTVVEFYGQQLRCFVLVSVLSSTLSPATAGSWRAGRPRLQLDGKQTEISNSYKQPDIILSGGDSELVENKTELKGEWIHQVARSMSPHECVWWVYWTVC